MPELFIHAEHIEKNRHWKGTRENPRAGFHFIEEEKQVLRPGTSVHINNTDILQYPRIRLNPRTIRAHPGEDSHTPIVFDTYGSPYKRYASIGGRRIRYYEETEKFPNTLYIPGIKTTWLYLPHHNKHHKSVKLHYTKPQRHLKYTSNRSARALARFKLNTPNIQRLNTLNRLVDGNIIQVEMNYHPQTNTYHRHQGYTKQTPTSPAYFMPYNFLPHDIPSSHTKFRLICPKNDYTYLQLHHPQSVAQEFILAQTTEPALSISHNPCPLIFNNLHLHSGYQSTLHISQGKNITFNNCWFSHTNDELIHIEDSQHIQFNQCKFSHYHNHALAILRSDHIKVQHSHFLHPHYPTPIGTDKSPHTLSTLYTYQSSHIEIINNHFPYLPTQLIYADQTPNLLLLDNYLYQKTPTPLQKNLHIYLINTPNTLIGRNYVPNTHPIHYFATQSEPMEIKAWENNSQPYSLIY